MRQALRFFVKDHLSLTIAFITSDALLIAFYQMMAEKPVEIIYPVALSMTVYIVYLFYDWYRYVSLYKKVNSLVKYKESNIELSGELATYICKSIEELHRSYGKLYYEQKENEQEERRFLSIWIHNMKTPLSVMRLLTEQLETEKINTNAFMEQTRTEEMRIQRDLDFILSMIRLKEFVKDYSPKEVDLCKEVRRIINEERRLFIYNGVYPKLSIEGNCFVLTDQKWNDMVIRQIISNAVKYSKGRKNAHVYFEVRQQGERTALVVRDEGMGMEEYDVARAFEPFFTGENGREIEGSSGIGLYFCKEVCEKLGHEITLTSKNKEGTIVTITYLTKL